MYYWRFWPHHETQLNYKTNNREKNEWQTRQRQIESYMGRQYQAMDQFN